MTIRPRIQRAFLAWLDEAQSRLTRRVLVTRRTDRGIEFTFDTGAPALYGWLGRHELSVWAKDGEVAWDLMADFDVAPKRVPQGHVCTMCLPAAREVYASREALWRDHLFEPLLAWVNENLATATQLALFQSEKGGSTWTQLVKTREAAAGAARVISLEAVP